LPTWGEILGELKTEGEKIKAPPFDSIRRKYLRLLSEYTHRNVILYATKWTQAGGVPPDFISINEEDVQGLMEVVHGLKGEKLDLIIHSPGGSPEAAEALVTYLRSKFSHIRVIIPYAAMSAATMLSCAANVTIMGKHSFIGPIDPQIILHTQLGTRAIPAQAILDQFEKAKKECGDPKNLGPWLPILGQYGPALIVQCENAIDLSRELVSKWLGLYMFSEKSNSKEEANRVATMLANHSLFKSHGRHINREQAKEIGLCIEDLETDQKLQDLVLSVFHSTTHTLEATSAVKIIENHEGRAFIKMLQQVAVPLRPMEPVKLPEKSK